MIGHPDERRLLAFHEGQLADRNRQRIAAHLASCQQCRNVVQGHRAIRAVFRLEASPAPGGVLERALATRAAGGVMVLPVVDPDPGTRPRTGLIAIITGAAAVLLLGVFQAVPLPVRSLTGVWDRWSRTIAEWRPSGSGGGIEIPEMFRAPVAKPAVVHPERLRPMTVTYRTIDHHSTDDGTTEGTHRFSLVEAEGDGSSWRVRHMRRDAYGNLNETLLHPQTLEPIEWVRTHRIAGSLLRQFHVRLQGDTVELSTSYPNGERSPYSDQVPAGTTTGELATPNGAPLALGSDHLFLMLMAADLSRSWSGSIGVLLSDVVAIAPYAVEPISFYVDGEERVETPAGTFDTWRIQTVEGYGMSAYVYWARRSDGLVVRVDQATGRGYETVRELLSVTYP